MVLKIISVGCTCLVGAILAFSEFVLHPENKDMKKRESLYQDSIAVMKAEIEGIKFDVDSVRGIAKLDTVIIWVHGYNQAKLDKACSYHFSDKNITIYMGEGKVKYYYVKEISSLTNKSKVIQGEGDIQDASIHKK